MERLPVELVRMTLSALPDVQSLHAATLSCPLFYRAFLGVETTITTHVFFANFAPWENEQLGCVHDFLDRAVSPAFNDIAEHDVAWGAFRVTHDQEVGSPYIQHVLSLGLEKLHQIAVAETYKERYSLLNASVGPSSTLHFLHEGLQDLNEHNGNIFLDSLGPDDEALYIRKPFFADPDPGPADIWRWAHQEESWASWLYQESRHGLRQWGYVLWDRPRLDAVGSLRTPWEDAESPSDLLLREQEVERQRGYMENSWEKREQIHRMGGSGWWSWGDESKVSWKGGVKPRQGRSVAALIKPNSLQEAREALSMMKLPLPAI